MFYLLAMLDHQLVDWTLTLLAYLLGHGAPQHLGPAEGDWQTDMQTICFARIAAGIKTLSDIGPHIKKLH